ncbi:hypothetical protein DQQ10_13330 [Pseudochryseolinea flava]|uniref:DUF4304 domain-containing protein n=2 Tax=Pseudochryseolinea flava TaxID=2059302 RepID=A0A364Y219_9BACT|nr:hypothetical protein DQQ10_13330 [Pseudochryseolinea flava]
MTDKQVKDTFNDVAKLKGFDSAFGGWFKESSECTVVLDLQKSNHGDIYLLNIKIFVQGMFAKNYPKSKDLVKKQVGNIFRRQPAEYDDVLKFNTSSTDDTIHRERMNSFFEEFVTPFTNKALSKAGIRALAKW